MIFQSFTDKRKKGKSEMLKPKSFPKHKCQQIKNFSNSILRTLVMLKVGKFSKSHFLCKESKKPRKNAHIPSTFEKNFWV